MRNNLNGNGDNPMVGLPQNQNDPIVGAVPSHVNQNLFLILWRHSWIIILVVLAALVAGFVQLARTTPEYRSTSKLYVEQSGPKIMGDMEKGIMTGSSNYLYTQAELMKASPILSEAVKKLEPRRLQTFGGGVNKVNFLRHALEVNVGKKDDIISVSILSPYPAEAADIINTVVDAYVTYHGTRKRSTAVEVLKILQSEKDKRGQELTERLHAMMDYKVKNEELAFQTDTTNVLMDRINTISVALTQAQLTTLNMQSAFETAKAQFEDPNKLADYFYTQQQQVMNKSLAGDTQGSSLKTQLVDLKLLRANRLLQLTEDHPAVIAIDNEISFIETEMTKMVEAAMMAKAMASEEGSESTIQEDQLESLKKAYLAEREQAYLAALKQEEKLTALFEGQREEAISLNEHISQYAILQQEWQQSRSICDILDTRIKELNVTEDAGVLNIAILEVAEPALNPSEPQRARFMAKAMMLGLALGVGLAFLRHMQDHRIRSAEEVTELLGIPLLGTVAAMSKQQSLSEKGQEVHKESTSPIAEAFRTIRTAVLFSIPKEQARIIQITSAEAGDGKSTLASNLSIAMAQSGQRILLVDADLRHPTQHKVFETHRDHGLSSVLAGMKTLEQVLHHTEIEGLDLLVAGPDVPNPADMLSSQALQDLLRQVSDTYDRIILDSPPIVSVADGSILATVCDASIIVVRAEKSSNKALQQARKILASVGAHLMGALVNDVKHGKGGSYGYGYGYGDYYSKHPGHDKKNGKKATESTRATAVS